MLCQLSILLSVVQLQVFHGADSDILWLQRDFHIYIANLFDTARVSLFFLEYAHSQAMSSPWHSSVNHFAFVSRPGLFAGCLIGKSDWVCLHLQACDVLGKPQRSLAYLLQTYCGIAVNKVYQVNCYVVVEVLACEHLLPSSHVMQFFE